MKRINLSRGWIIHTYEDTGILRVVHDPDKPIYTSDEEAAKAAVACGVRVIPVNELPADFHLPYYGWLDTPENRRAIEEYCK